MRLGIRTGALALLATAAILAPLGSQAGVCDHNTVVFSGNSANTAGSVNPFAAWCTAAGGDEFDSRVIYPGSDQIRLRYTQDLGESTILIATIDGLGFDHLQVELKRRVTTTATAMDSAYLPLPAGLATSGCLSVVIFDKADENLEDPLDYTVWHTQDKQLGC